MSTTEELSGRKRSVWGLENRDYSLGIRHADDVAYLQNAGSDFADKRLCTVRFENILCRMYLVGSKEF
jgi:hypothetical protein